MREKATINARIDPVLKEKAENILHKLNLSAEEAVRLFYTQICLQKGLPFAVKIPKKVTADNKKTHNYDLINKLGLKEFLEAKFWK